jgi:hypothetical protein
MPLIILPKPFHQFVQYSTPAITTTSLPGTIVGVPYSLTMAASGGRMPYQWYIQSDTGSGLTLNPNTGVLSGTPGTVGSFTLLIQAVDANGVAAVESFGFTVAALPLAASIGAILANAWSVPPPLAQRSVALPIGYTPVSIATTSPLPAATVGSAYSFSMSTVPGTGMGALSWIITSGTLPAGMTFTNGVFSGTPTATASVTLGIKVTDSAIPPTSAQGTFSITVNAATPSQQMKFFNGHILESQGYETTGTSFATSGQTQATSFPGGYIGEINQLATCPNIGAYMLWSNSGQLEDYTQPTNLALTQAAGATGAALQTAINNQFPGFNSRVAPAFYYQQAVRYNSPFTMGVNFTRLNSFSLTPAQIAGNWGTGTTNPRIVPQYVATCGGSLTVPTSYGATTTTTYPVAPLNGNSGAYGMMFGGWTGTAYSIGVPLWTNPGVNYANRIQLYQAFALWQFPAGATWSSGGTYTAGTPLTDGSGNNYLCVGSPPVGTPLTNTTYFKPNPWAGLTPSNNPQFVYHKNNDEYSYDFSGGPDNPPMVGTSGYPSNPTTMRQAHDTWCQGVTAALPTTPFGDCSSFGANFGPNGNDSNTTMAFLVNALLPGNTLGTSRIRGYVQSNSDTEINDWNLIAGDSNPQAPATYAAGIGWGVAPNVVPAHWPSTGQINHVAAYDLTGQMGKERQVQNFDYHFNPGPSPPEPGPNTQAAVGSIATNALYEGAHIMTWSPTSDAATGGQPAYSTLYWNDPTHGFIYPGITTWVNANKTAGNPTGLMGQLPTKWMYGPSISSATNVTSSSATINWPPITNQGTASPTSSAGINLKVIRNGVALPAGTVAASAGTFTDKTATTGQHYIYALQMVNSNGTGPAGPGFPVNTP